MANFVLTWLLAHCQPRMGPAESSPFADALADWGHEPPPVYLPLSLRPRTPFSDKFAGSRNRRPILRNDAMRICGHGETYIFTFGSQIWRHRPWPIRESAG